VYQIALKYYGLKGSSVSSGKKVSVTPKIYNDINAKLVNIWGDYAGWAHSILFTADLKSFASYGHDVTSASAAQSSSSSESLPGGMVQTTSQDILPIPPMAPLSSTPSKRAHLDLAGADLEGTVTLAKCVKRRRH